MFSEGCQQFLEMIPECVHLTALFHWIWFNTLFLVWVECILKLVWEGCFVKQITWKFYKLSNAASWWVAYCATAVLQELLDAVLTQYSTLLLLKVSL